MHKMEVDADVFSSGQIGSKIWLCETLENLKISNPQVVWVYGGWHGMASFLLLSRGIFPVKHIRSFDIDPTCEITADIVLGNWVWKEWKFKAFSTDCNYIDFNDYQYGDMPNLIINTSSEHFMDDTWYKNIPSGTIVAIQSNNMLHVDHYSCVQSLTELIKKYKFSKQLAAGSLDFKYPEWEFTRYMSIGIK